MTEATVEQYTNTFQYKQENQAMIKCTKMQCDLWQHLEKSIDKDCIEIVRAKYSIRMGIIFQGDTLLMQHEKKNSLDEASTLIFEKIFKHYQTCYFICTQYFALKIRLM